MAKKKATKERQPPVLMRSTTTVMKVKKQKKEERPQLIWTPGPGERAPRRRKELQTPTTRDLDEMRRLMNRTPAVQKREEGCAVCNSQNHYRSQCPSLDKIPRGVVLNFRYDYVCLGCGKIGDNCCSKGTYAILKFCGGCYDHGHWFWEKRCKKGTCFPPSKPLLPFTEYEEVPCPYEHLKDQEKGPWYRMVDPTSDQDTDGKEQQPRNLQKKIVRAVKKRAI